MSNINDSSYHKFLTGETVDADGSPTGADLNPIFKVFQTANNDNFTRLLKSVSVLNTDGTLKVLTNLTNILNYIKLKEGAGIQIDVDPLTMTFTFTVDPVGTFLLQDGSVTSPKLADDLVLAGEPTTTTPDAGTNNERLATTAFVVAAILGLAPFDNPVFTGSGVTLPGDPIQPLHAAPKQYVDALVQGIVPKASVRVATTANITLSGNQIIDGIAATTGDRVLVKNQTIGANNGIYVSSPIAWARATDADTNSEVVAGITTFVTEGTANGLKSWTLVTNNPIVLGTTPLAFSVTGSASDILAGDALLKVGNTLNVNFNPAAFTLNSGMLTIVDQAVTDIKISNLTMNDTLVPLGDTRSLHSMISNIGYMLKQITGKASWRTNPVTTLEAINTAMALLAPKANPVFTGTVTAPNFSGELNGVRFSVGATAPSAPSTDDMWVDTTNLVWNRWNGAAWGTVGGGSGGGGSGDMLKSVYDTNNNGVVDKAAKLETPRTIQLSGSVAGSATFDGSANVVITTTGGGTGGGASDGSLNLKTDFGAVGNGVANDTTPIQNALNSGSKIKIPPGTYLISGTITANILTSILEGVGNVTFKSTGSIQQIDVIKGTAITGINFENVYLYLRSSHTNPGKFIIDRCNWKNTFYGVRLEVSWSGVGFQGAMPKNVNVTNCVFDGHSYGIYGAASDSYFAHNILKNTLSRNIHFDCGSNNVIFDNWVDGGVTGIIFLIDASINQRKPANNNVIHANHVFNISEEGISFDGNADTAIENSSRITGTVASIDASSTARIIPSFALSTADEHTDFYVTFHTGKSRGQSHKIANMGTGTQWLEIPTADKNFITVGDKFTVVVGCVGNIISNNVVKVAQTGITCYGAGNGTIIEGNYVSDCFGDMGILIRSLYGTNGGDLGIVHNSLVQGNVVENCEIAANINFFGGNPISVLAVGNKFQDNTVTNGHVQYEYQLDDTLCRSNTSTGNGDSTPTQPDNVQYTANGVPMVQTIVEAGTVTWAFGGLAYDLFTRGADNASSLASANVGGAWTAVAGTWGTISNEAYSASDAANNIAVLPTVGSGNYTVSCGMKGDIDDSGNRRRPALVFRYVDSGNFLLAYLEAGFVFIGKSDGGTTSDLVSYPYATVDNTWYNFKVICKNNFIKVFVNGVCVASKLLDPSDQVKYGNAGQVGMRLSKSGAPSVAARWRRLVVETN